MYINTTRGNSTHNHSVNISGTTDYETWDNTKVGAPHGSNMGAHYHNFSVSGNTNAGNNLPPYYILAYIIKL